MASLPETTPGRSGKICQKLVQCFTSRTLEPDCDAYPNKTIDGMSDASTNPPACLSGALSLDDVRVEPDFDKGDDSDALFSDGYYDVDLADLEAMKADFMLKSQIASAREVPDCREVEFFEAPGRIGPFTFSDSESSASTEIMEWDVPLFNR